MYPSSLLIITLGVLPVGCTQNVYDSCYHGDTAFTSAERYDIERAAQVMAVRTGGMPVTIVWDGKTVERQSIVKLRNDHNDGYWDPVERRVYIAPNLIARSVYDVASHELGHMYGMQHHAGPGVMGRCPIGAAHLNRGCGHDWTAEDTTECMRVGLCQEAYE